MCNISIDADFDAESEYGTGFVIRGHWIEEIDGKARKIAFIGVFETELWATVKKARFTFYTGLWGRPRRFKRHKARTCTWMAGFCRGTEREY